MSVIMSKRNKSPIEFIDEGRKICTIIPDRMITFLKRLCRDYKDCRKVAKKVFNYLYELPIKSSIEALHCLKLGNSIKIKDKETYIKRRDLFRKSIDWYNKLALSYSVLYEQFWKRKTIKYNTVKNVISIVDIQVTRIKNVMKHDLIIYNKLGVKNSLM